jgi:hypothetical protein
MLPIEFPIANDCTTWRGVFEELSLDEGQAKSAPLALMKIYRMTPLSSRSISMGSTFKASYTNYLRKISLG